MSIKELVHMKTMKFSSRALAFSFANRGKGLVVILGDDGKYWVVTMRKAAELEKQGYEWA